MTARERAELVAALALMLEPVKFERMGITGDPREWEGR